MTITTNEWISAVASVVTAGDLEILERDPFTARLGAIRLQTFVFQPADVTVVELIAPVAELEPSAALDRWIARSAPRLYSVHVAARDVNDITFVEVRSSLIANGMTIEVFERALTLLKLGADDVCRQLPGVLEAAMVRASMARTSSMPWRGPSVRVSDLPARGSMFTAASSLSPGYL